MNGPYAACGRFSAFLRGEAKESKIIQAIVSKALRMSQAGDRGWKVI